MCVEPYIKYKPLLKNVNRDVVIERRTEKYGLICLYLKGVMSNMHLAMARVKRRGNQEKILLP